MAIEIFFAQKYAKIPKYYENIQKFNKKAVWWSLNDFEA